MGSHISGFHKDAWARNVRTTAVTLAMQNPNIPGPIMRCRSSPICHLRDESPGIGRIHSDGMDQVPKITVEADPVEVGGDSV